MLMAYQIFIRQYIKLSFNKFFTKHTVTSRYKSDLILQKKNIYNLVQLGKIFSHSPAIEYACSYLFLKIIKVMYKEYI